MAATKQPYIQGSLYEENYLLRTLGPLVTSPEIALTELVANAWDAGATKVDICIPDDYGQALIVADNGIGLTKEQFHSRWMKLGYDRLKHQGKEVTFPKGVVGKRFAYGRNGVGRHGLLCFNNEYKVETNSGAKKAVFNVTTLSETQPFVIRDESFSKADGIGTRLEVITTRNLPTADRILSIISARFLHDPKFTISINGKTVPLAEHKGLIASDEIEANGVKMKVHFIDTQKTARSTLYQGVAFWQGGRLVGEPSWALGNNILLDGRTKYAKRYSVVVESSDLGPFIKEDWTGFKKKDGLEDVFDKVSGYVDSVVQTLAKENVDETKEQIKQEFATQISSLSPLGKYEVNEAIEHISIVHPTAKPEAISLAVDTIINLERTKTGKELLVKLSRLTDDDIQGLNTILDNWTVRDALSVLDEIDNRLSVIEAIRKLSGDKDVDELHVLHPLINGARWLFGPEFDSAEFVSNRQLQTVVETLFKTKVQKGVFNNHKKRPDIVVLGDATISLTGTEGFDSDTSLSTVQKVLLIELKRGDFKLTRDERNQAMGYVEDIMNCGSLIGNPYIDAFVVGQRFAEKVQPITTVINDNKVEMGKVRICLFSQLVDTAEKRLFGLRQKLSERYDDIPGMDLFNKQGVQLSVNLT